MVIHGSDRFVISSHLSRGALPTIGLSKKIRLNRLRWLFFAIIISRYVENKSENSIKECTLSVHLTQRWKVRFLGENC